MQCVVNQSLRNSGECSRHYMDVSACKESEQSSLPMSLARAVRFTKVIKNQHIAMFIRCGMALAKESVTRRDMGSRSNCEGEA